MGRAGECLWSRGEGLWGSGELVGSIPVLGVARGGGTPTLSASPNAPGKLLLRRMRNEPGGAALSRDTAGGARGGHTGGRRHTGVPH